MPAAADIFPAMISGAAAPGETPACRHCGRPLANAAARTSGFCCAGCAYVFRLVNEHGLADYYKIRDDVVAPAGPAVFQPRDYAWLATLQAEAEKSGGTPELTLEVQGISCAGCVWLIEKVFHQQPGALLIETDAQTGRMRVRWEARRFELGAFARKIQTLNYLVGPVGVEAPASESRRLTRLVGLCAAFSMNVMLFTLPVYFGMDAAFSYARLFGLLAFCFATLSVLTGGMYFLGRAAQAVRMGVIHLDLPISLGIAGAYLGSVYGWLVGLERFVYFDFVSAFIFLMVVGRWAQTAAVERNRRQLLSAHVQPHAVDVETPHGRVERPVSELHPSEVFFVRSGQILPVEARLESAAATVGMAWISGEADARECRAGSVVPSGAVNLSPHEIQVRATQPWADSLLAQLLEPKTHAVYRNVFLEKVIRGYLVGILLIAAGAGVAWWLGSHDLVRTWTVVTAVLVVSCPCAIGLAFPLTDELATVALRRCGVFVREADLWARLARVRKIVFDKTGTLTEESPQLKNPETLDGLNATQRAALFAMVRHSPHPVSQSLHQQLLATGAGLVAVAGEVVESPGNGLILETPSGRWTLGRPGWSQRAEPGRAVAGKDTEFYHDGRLVMRFGFVDAVRVDAACEIAALRGSGFETFILSGDRKEKVEIAASAAGIPLENALGEFSPQDKATWLRHFDRRDTMMLGDGANDSLAFDVAFVRGTPAVHRNVLNQKADFYYLGRGLAGVRQLFEVDHQRRRTQRVLLGASVAYNMFAVGLAVAGMMNPLLAAILMPVSSLATLTIVGLGMRGALKTST